MKRIMNGVTYNTETATKIARWEDPNLPSSDFLWTHVEVLYQTRGGAFFIHQKEEPLSPEGRTYDTCRPISQEEARRWVVEGNDVEVYSNVFELPPEAAAEAAPGATIFLRVPQSLKTRIEMAANQSGTSINTYGLRCLERCLGTGD
jgi:hypothetical protein